MFDPDATGKVKVSVFEEEILVKIGEPMDEKEVFFQRLSTPFRSPSYVQVADTMKNLADSGAVEGEELVYEIFVTWIMDQLNK